MIILIIAKMLLLFLLQSCLNLHPRTQNPMLGMQELICSRLARRRDTNGTFTAETLRVEV